MSLRCFNCHSFFLVAVSILPNILNDHLSSSISQLLRCAHVTLRCNSPCESLSKFYYLYLISFFKKPNLPPTLTLTVTPLFPLFFFFFWINKHYSISLISQRNRIYKQHVTLLFPNLPSTMSHLINWNPNFPMKFGIKFLMFDEISYCILNEICSPRFMH